jgi:hypothetical protein
MKVKKIEVVFENCEEITVPTSDISFMYASDITSSAFIQNILSHDDVDVHEHKTAGVFSLRIKNKPEYSRILQYSDITQIHLYGHDDSHDWFYVEWGDGEYRNEYQKTEIQGDEILIRIAKEDSR